MLLYNWPGLFLIPPSDNLYISDCLHLQNVNMPEMKLKQISVKKPHLSHHYWQKINWLTFLSTKSAQWDLIQTILCQQALSNTLCMMEDIIKSNVCHASEFSPRQFQNIVCWHCFTFVCVQMSRTLCNYVAENVLSISLTINQKIRAQTPIDTHVCVCWGMFNDTCSWPHA